MTPTLPAARLMLVIAAVLWSTSSVFMRMIQKPSLLQLESPALSPLQIAFYRSVFAGLAVLLLVRRRHITLKPLMIAMLLAFGVMTALYLSALGLGSAANAILLQNTSPVWVYFLGVWLLGDPKDTRSMKAVLLALVGAVVIVIGNWPRNLAANEQAVQGEILLMAAGSGFFYAVVVLLLRALNRESSAWLSVLNLLGGSLVIAAFALLSVGFDAFPAWLTAPTPAQFAFIAVYGIVQLAIPYVLFTYGLKTVSPQEAGIITLIEPLLNPVWAYLIAPESETPTVWTLLGGAILLAAMVWRYR